ncbi:MAG TPA: carboxypeptidase-like regulatory domain-containing protein [Vicinamibacteria bacterium]|nr:carboxypeptidase-like regulatory domain-containing protein [Vicinamibacteria bacterium]
MAKNGSVLCQSALVLALFPLALAAQPAKPTPKPTPLPSPPALEGTVKGSDGKPVEKAVVMAVSEAARWTDPPVTAETNAQGRFSLKTGSRAKHSLRVEARGWAAQVLDGLRPGSPIAVTLSKGGIIEGVVRDSGTGAPVPGARVEARGPDAGTFRVPWSPDAGRLVTKTDARGAYRLEGVGPGTHDLTARSAEAGRGQKRGVRAGSRADLLLVSGASLLVTVQDAEGRPLPGALVRAEPSPRLGMRSPAERTDAGGRFEFAGLDPGSYLVVAQHPDFAIEQSAPLQLERESRAHAPLRLARPVTVIGRLVGDAEKPVAGSVTVQERDGAQAPQALAELLKADAGADGRFKLERVAPGSYALAALARGHAPDRVEAVVGAKETVVNLGDIKLEVGLTIRGRVREKGGAPIVEATISAMPANPPATSLDDLRVEADGSFALAGLQPGAYRLTTTAPGYARDQRQASTGTENLEIVLDPAGTIAGTVVDETGRPVESFTVAAQDAASGRGGMRGPGLRESLTAADGRFLLDGATAGTWVVTVEAAELAPATVSNVKVAMGGTTDLGMVRLTRGGALRGTVVEGDGRAVPAAQVTARAGGGDMMIFYGDRLVADTDLEGAFEIKGLPAGTVSVLASHPSYAKGQATGIEIDPSKGPAQTRIVMTRGGRIEGSARNRDGSPMLGVQVQLWPAEAGLMMGMPEPVTIQGDGSFVIERVTPGKHRAVLMAGSASALHSTQTREVSVREGETSTVDFSSREILVSGRVTRNATPVPNVKLRLSGGTFTAVMRFAGGAPNISARTAGPERMNAVTRDDGSYEMIAEEPGSANLSLESLDGKTRYLSRSVELPDAATHVLDLDLPSQQVAGLVLDKDGGQPLGEARVSAQGTSVTTGTDGRFSLEVEAGDCRVTAEADGYASESVQTVAGSAAAGELRLELLRGLSLAGKVIDAQGRPAGSVRVMASAGAATAPLDGPADSALALADGSFRFDRLKAQTYNLVSGSRTLGWGVAAGVEPGGKEVTVRLTPGGTVKLVVRGPGGAPLPGARASIVAVGGLPVAVPSFAASDASGSAELGSPAGSVELRVTKDKLAGRVTISVPSGGTVPAEVTLAEERPR